MSYAESAPRGLVLADLWQGGRARSAALVGLGALFTGLLAQVSIPLPGTPVPLTLQTFGVLLVGTSLGPRLGVASMATYVGLGLVGVPWFAGGAAGYFATTFGYLIGFIAAAAVCGALARRKADRSVVGTLATMALGSLVIYACGVPVLAWAAQVDLATAIRLGVVPFLIGDAIKMAVAAGLFPSVWRVLQDH